METKHTPGPWQATTIDENGGYDCMTAAIRIYARGPGASTLAELDMRHYGQEPCGIIAHDSPGFKQFIANARLIAASPELLDALLEVKRWNDVSLIDAEWPVVMEAINKVIAKATGKSTLCSSKEQTK